MRWRPAFFAALAACLASAIALVVAAPARAEDEQLPKLGEYVYLEELPEALTKVAPVYPAAARNAGISGVVAVQALVGKDGRVRDVHIAKSIPPLDAAAADAVRQWTFKPATSKGEPVAVWVVIPVAFHLDGEADTPRAVPPPAPPAGASPRPLPPGPRDRVAPAPVPMPTTELQHPVWPPEKGRAPEQKYEHPIWPPEWSKGDDRVVPARGTRVDSLPRVVKRVAPDLRGLTRANLEGLVVVEAVVGADGKVKDARIAQSVPMLDSAALEALRQWRFRPALRGVRPVTARVYVPVRFAPAR